MKDISGIGDIDQGGYRIAFFGSSLVSAWWNGAATYYRGILAALHRRGCEITFYEPDAFDRQRHRDLAEDPDYARVVVYPGDEPEAWRPHFDKAAQEADVVVKASGVGVFDAELEIALAELAVSRQGGPLCIFWDVDAPATLDRIAADVDDHARCCVPEYDAIFTYGGGPPVVSAYERIGAKCCLPIYNAHDPATHFPAEADPRFEADLAFLGNRLPDRESRVKQFFLNAAEMRPDQTFLLGGNGWEPQHLPKNIHVLGHVGTADHNAFNCTPRAVLNVSRASMANYGYSPATRVFEAAAAGACLITDAWVGIDTFFAPGKEILIAEDAADVVKHLDELTPDRVAHIGATARKRALTDHTYDGRAEEVLTALGQITLPTAVGR